MGGIVGFSNLSAGLGVEVAGYGGFILKYMLKAIGGDIISSIILFIILGQTIALIIAYLKRLFYCIVLGVVAPLIVAFDTIKKVIGQKSDILDKWFQNFVITVFMQSFHAIFLMFILKVLSALDGSDGVQSLMALVGTTALIKFEKLFKELFGIKDSFGGSIKGAGAKALLAVKGVTSAAKNLTDNAGKEKKATARRDNLMSKRSSLINALNATPTANATATPGGGVTTNVTNNVSPGSVTPSGIIIGSDSAPISAQVADSERNMLNGTTGTPSGAGGVGSASAIAANTQAINNLVAALNRKEQKEEANDRKAKEEELKQVEKELQDANKDVAGARFARMMAPAVALGSAGIGFGMMDETSESLTVAGGLASAGDWAAEKIGRRAAKSENQRIYEETVEQGRENIKLKVDDSALDKAIEKMKTLDGMRDIVKTATIKMTVDPIKKSANQFKEIGAVIRGKTNVDIDDVGDIE